jgi:hypothetical protein
MKKLLFVIAGVFSVFSLSSMNGPCRQRLDEYVKNYKDDAPIDSGIFKDALRETIGPDNPAIQAYELFHKGKYQELLEHWIGSHAKMHPDNAQRFKELLIWITTIEASKDDSLYLDDSLYWDTWNSKYKERILTIIGNRNNVTRDMFHHFQFCYELLFSKLVDIGKKGESFYIFNLCDDIAFYSKIDSISTENVVGYVDPEEDFYSMFRLFPNMKNPDRALEAIGHDEVALQEYELFQKGEYQELLEHWIGNHTQMHPDNAQRFKELLIWLTSIKATEDSFDKWDTWNSKYKELILTIIGDRNNVTIDMFHYFQFCYELVVGKSIGIGIQEKSFSTSRLWNDIGCYSDIIRNHTEDVAADDCYFISKIFPNIGIHSTAKHP